MDERMIEELTNRAADAEDDPGDRIVLSRVGYGNASRVPFSGGHGHPYLPSEAVETIWLTGDYWESIGAPATITVTIEVGGELVPAPLTEAEREILKRYDDEQVAKEQQERVNDERSD